QCFHQTFLLCVDSLQAREHLRIQEVQTGLLNHLCFFVKFLWNKNICISRFFNDKLSAFDRVFHVFYWLRKKRTNRDIESLYRALSHIFTITLIITSFQIYLQHLDPYPHTW